MTLCDDHPTQHTTSVRAQMPAAVVCRMLQKVWLPRRFLVPAECACNKPFAVLVLNRPVCIHKDLAIGLWNNAVRRVLVDGGANRWLTFGEQQLTDAECSTLRDADLLTGDFDSVSDATLAKFRACGTRITATPDQDATDFTKALLELRTELPETKLESVVALVDSGGRIDHTMANINSMCKALQFLPDSTAVYALCSDSISWLLRPGVEHCIEVPAEMVRSERWCSFVPINGRCTVTTSGLKWDVYNDVVEFGGMVSTSNTYASERITIRSDGLLYWSMGIAAETE